MELLYKPKKYRLIQTDLTRIQCIEILEKFPDYQFYQKWGTPIESHYFLDEKIQLDMSTVYQLHTIVDYEKFNQLLITDDSDPDVLIKPHSDLTIYVLSNNNDDSDNFIEFCDTLPKELYLRLEFERFDIAKKAIKDVSILKNETFYNLFHNNPLLNSITDYYQMIDFIIEGKSFLVKQI